MRLRVLTSKPGKRSHFVQSLALRWEFAEADRRPESTLPRRSPTILETRLNINAKMTSTRQKVIEPGQRQKCQDSHSRHPFPQRRRPPSQGNSRKPSAPIHDHLADRANYSVPRDYFESLVRQHLVKHVKGVAQSHVPAIFHRRNRLSTIWFAVQVRGAQVQHSSGMEHASKQFDDFLVSFQMLQSFKADNLIKPLPQGKEIINVVHFELTTR